jgi:hypothetical protein
MIERMADGHTDLVFESFDQAMTPIQGMPAESL